MESEDIIVPNFESFAHNFKDRYFTIDEEESDDLWKYAVQKKGIFLYTLAEEEDTNNATINVEKSIFVDKELNLKVYSRGKRVELSGDQLRLVEYAQLSRIMRMLDESKKIESILNEGTDGISDDSYQNVEYLENEDIHHNDHFKGQQDKSLQCSICSKCFKKPSTLRDHLNIHTNSKPHVCSVCTRSFSFETTLASHIKLHQNVKNHKCSYCSKAFARRRNMLHHERTVHLKEKPFVCPVCEKPYTDRVCWKNHIATHQAPKEGKSVPIRVKSIRPNVKPKVALVAATEKKPRQRRNTGPKRNKCDLCDKMFARRRNVLHHMTYTHNKIKAHECQFCGKKYSDITSFKRHIRGHTDPEVQRPQLAAESTMVSDLLVGDLGELEFAPEGNDETITFIVITES